MKRYTYTQIRQNLKRILLEVTENHERVRIVSRKGRNAILIDEDDYNSLLETAYLLRNPQNAKRLLEAKKRSLEESISFQEVLRELEL